ncbi:MAG: trigger factor [Thermoguttaceae bacterium]|nr:trigger factor [Thermoguttaceae bacterium]
MAETETLQADLPESDAVKLDMSVEVKEVSSCQRHVKVTIAADEVAKYRNREIDEFVEKAIVPGFRVGKAPRKVIERKFNDQISDRVKQSLLLDSLAQVNEAEKLVPISEPDINVKAVVVPAEGPFVYEYNIEVRPEFELPNWKGLKIDRPVREFTDADIDEAIEILRNNNGILVNSDEPAKANDYIVTKLTFTHEGKVISSADSETLRIRPTLSFRDGVINDFDKLMVGVKAGDVRETTVKLTENTPNKELQGKELDAKFEVKEVKVLELPEVDNDFIFQFGGFESMGDFRDAVLDVLKRQLDHEQRRRARAQIADALTSSTQFDLPPALLDNQSIREAQRQVMEMRRSGFSESQIASQINFLRQNSRTQTAKALKEHFILEKIADTENITDDPVDYDTEIALMAAQSGSSPRRVRAQIEKSGEMDILRNQIIERKVIDLIMSEAKFKDVPYEIKGEQEEALNRSAGSDEVESDIPEVTEEEVKEAAHEEATKPAMKGEKQPAKGDKLA